MTGKRRQKVRQRHSWSHRLLILALFALVACGGAGGDAESDMAGEEPGGEETAAEGGAEDLAPLAVSMPVVPPNFVMLQPWLSQELGFFEHFGLPEVEIVSLETGVDALRGAEAGSADIAAVPTPTLINAVAQGAQVKAYYTYSPGLEVQMVVAPEIQSCEDLDGKVLAVDEVGGFAEVLTKFYYQSCGLTQDDVQYGNFPGAEGQAIAQGQAVSGVLHIDEAQGVIEQFPDAGLHVLANLWEVVPDWHYAGYASPVAILEQKREELVRFVAANICATEFMYDTGNKDRVVEIGVEITGLSESIISDTYDTFVEDEIWPKDNGYPEEMVEFTAQQQVELGNIEDPGQVPSYDEVVDPSIYDDARALVDEMGCPSA